MTMTETPNTTPARRPERITEGNALQVIDIRHPETGEFSRQLVMRGTPDQVRSYGQRDFFHPSQNRWHQLDVAANYTTREQLLAHIDDCHKCHVDEEIAGYLPTDTVEELAEFVALSHLVAYQAMAARNSK